MPRAQNADDQRFALCQRAVEQLKKSVGLMDDVEVIYVTGGGAPLMGRAIKKYLPKYASIVRTDPDPVGSNVRGFQIIGELLHARALKAGTDAGRG